MRSIDRIRIDREKEFLNEQERLRKKFGRTPNEFDVLWGIMNQELLRHAQEGHWGLYRNTRLDMANLLQAEGETESALQTYLEVAYLDLNGPMNTGRLDSDLATRYPPFDKETAFLAPGLLDFIDETAAKLQISKKTIKERFIEHNQKVFQALSLPLSVEKCWLRLEKQINN